MVEALVDSEFHLAGIGAKLAETELIPVDIELTAVESIVDTDLDVPSVTANA
ncbi:hypothetical protein [Caballeronia grimmiae]|uniref:Uncharacterized protein n=1 Tax=Caballeronia grimmiae TaxID=1071679 RepID=A0ABQ1S4Q3_9BURK|nr:hypothetical protein [Caballeronia grimmiae]GGD90551.1 hypothetical protein GCM10010985_51480 [Caballeronia grimmiae]